ncbi:flagellar motor stator protein MotA [Candidatus Magnetoovum chiemensis]|nr:flagellar motor stator protein MotA [Candidatus Magnetoovum chiemensis]
MFLIIGIVIVIGSVLTGYLMVHGNLAILFQPAELVIIFGAALGSLVIASPLRVLKLIIGNIKLLLATSGASKAVYVDVLMLLFGIAVKARKEGLIALEGEVYKPKESALFSNFPKVLQDHHLVDFICDNLKVITAAAAKSHELDELMDMDIEVRHHEESIPATSLTSLSDSLPGLGIVAAVLGIVVTMGKINEPPEILGHHIGAALVGTFLGILASYGFMGPMATNLGFKMQEKAVCLSIAKAILIAIAKGIAPQMAIEYGRRAIPMYDRPSFDEVNDMMKAAKSK